MIRKGAAGGEKVWVIVEHLHAVPKLIDRTHDEPGVLLADVDRVCKAFAEPGDWHYDWEWDGSWVKFRNFTARMPESDVEDFIDNLEIALKDRSRNYQFKFKAEPADAFGNPNPGDEFEEYAPEDRGILKEVQAAFDDFEESLSPKHTLRSELDRGFTVTHGYVPAWRSLLSPEFDRRTAKLSEATLQSGILNEMFEETCQRLGDQGIIIWDDDADGTVLWAGTEKAHHRQTGE